MEFCEILDSDWERWGLWVNSINDNDGIFDFSSSLDESLTSGLVDGNNNDAKSDAFAKWMDEKMDLSVVHPEGRSGLLDDLDAMIEDPTTFLEIMMGSPSVISESDLEILNPKSEKEEGRRGEASESVATPDSPGGRVPDDTLSSSPEYYQESFYKSVSPENPSTPADQVLEEPDLLASSYLKSEANSPDVPALCPNFNHWQSSSPGLSVASTETLDSVDSKDSYNKIEAPRSSPLAHRERAWEGSDSDEKEATSDEGKRAEECGPAQRRRKNRKKSLSERVSATGEFRRERKRKQNKDAATRYRQKKRKESVAIKTEESILEERNVELKSRVQQLSNEISYLKGLLKEAKLRMQSASDSTLVAQSLP